MSPKMKIISQFLFLMDQISILGHLPSRKYSSGFCGHSGERKYGSNGMGKLRSRYDRQKRSRNTNSFTRDAHM